MKMCSGSLATLSLSGLLAIVATPAFGQPAPAPPAAQSGDQSFAMQMAQSGLAEVQMAQLALKKSKDPKVVAFARQMIQDHTKNNQQLQSVMSSAGMTPPNDVGPANAAVMQQLQSQSGTAFDRAYLDSQVTAHQKVLALLQNEVRDGTNGSLKSYAQATLPVIQEHLRMAQQDAGATSGGAPSPLPS